MSGYNFECWLLQQSNASFEENQEVSDKDLLSGPETIQSGRSFLYLCQSENTVCPKLLLVKYTRA